MSFFSYSVITAIIAGVIAFLALPMLFSRGWVLAWLKGCLAFFLLAASVFLFAGAAIISSYDSQPVGQSVAQVTMVKKDVQDYELTLHFQDRNPVRYSVAGDLWQIDAKILVWRGLLQRFGLSNGYQFTRISGRYHEVLEEQSRPRTLYEMKVQNRYFDLRGVLAAYEFFNLVEAFYGSSAFVPMASGAAYEVFVTETGLLVKPLTEEAIQAVALWH